MPNERLALQEGMQIEVGVGASILAYLKMT